MFAIMFPNRSHFDNWETICNLYNALNFQCILSDVITLKG